MANAAGRLFVGTDSGAFTLDHPGGEPAYLPLGWADWIGPLGDQAVIASSSEIWLSDGTRLGTRRVGVGFLAALDDRAAYFVGRDDAPGLFRLRRGSTAAERLDGPIPAAWWWSGFSVALPLDRAAGALEGGLIGASQTPEATSILAVAEDASAASEIHRIPAAGPADGLIHGLAAVPGGVVFLGRAADGRTALYRSDGTGRGTVPIAVYDQDPERLSDGSVWTIGDAVYFFVRDDGQTRLHRTDSTAAGTRVIDLTSPSGEPALPYMDYRWKPANLFLAREARTNPDRFWLVLLDPATDEPRWLHEVDQTAVATAQVRDNLFVVSSWGSDAVYVDASGVETPIPLPDGASRMGWVTAAGGRVYFTAYCTEGDAWWYDLWASDGPGETPRRVTDLRIQHGFQVLPAGDRVILIVDDGRTVQFWATRTDGRGVEGPASFPSFDYWNSSQSGGWGGAGWCVPLDPAAGREVWRADDRGFTLLAQTIAGPDGNAVHLRSLGDRLAFTAPTAGGGPELWLSDGTPGGTRSLSAFTGTTRVLDGREAAVSGGLLFLTGSTPEAGEELWAVRLCAPDYTGDGIVDSADYDGFVGAFEAGDRAADFNADGFLDFFDYADFVAAFERGC